MKISLKLIETNQIIQKNILDALLPQVSTFMNKASKYIESNIHSIIKQAIVEQPEYDSLVSGQLRLELGIPDASFRIEDLINAWINNTVIEYKEPKIFNNRIKSSFTIKIIKSDFSDVLNLSAASIQTMEYSLPWLQWLLLDGTAIVVDNYDVFIGPNTRSRTGFAIMRGTENRGWGVPPEYAGTISDNWITRAIESCKKDVEALLEKAINQ